MASFGIITQLCTTIQGEGKRGQGRVGEDRGGKGSVPAVRDGEGKGRKDAPNLPYKRRSAIDMTLSPCYKGKIDCRANLEGGVKGQKKGARLKPPAPVNRMSVRL